jgi:hypothetical protein
MRIRLTIPGEPNAETLGIALEAATRLAQHDIASGNIPPVEEAIDQGIQWQPEPPGDESFDKPSTVLERGWGDCDDFAPWLAGEMRETGYDEGASAFAVRSGPQTWHALVRGSDGQVYDPSRWAGMPYNVVGACAACSRPLNVGKPAIAIGRRSVRVDMPGLQATHGCVIGTAHVNNCLSNDEDRVRTLVQTIEDAIVTAQLARTGDRRAIKSLAVIYRVLRGDDPETACSGMQIRPDQVGIDFSSPSVRNFIQRAREVLATAADELFNGETWTFQNGHAVKARKVAMSGHRMGFIPCLAPLAPIVSAAVTAGTIAAVLDPIAKALRELAGKDSDFGRAMATLSDALGDVKLVSAVGAGALALAAEGIPAGIEATTARWAELLHEPGSQTAALDVKKAQDVAKTIAWAERALSSKLPAELATQLAPPILDLSRGLGDPKFDKEVVKTMADLIKKTYKGYLDVHRHEPGFLPPSFVDDEGKRDRLAEAVTTQVFGAFADHPEPIDLVTFPAGTYTPAPAQSEEPYGPPAPEMLPVEIQQAEKDREDLRTVPILVSVPVGWDPIFAMGCRQLTGQCPT